MKDDCVAYLRESKKETLLVVVARKSTKVDIDLSAYGYSIENSVYGPAAHGSRLRLTLEKPTVGIWRLQSSKK